MFFLVFPVEVAKKTYRKANLFRITVLLTLALLQTRNNLFSGVFLLERSKMWNFFHSSYEWLGCLGSVKVQQANCSTSKMHEKQNEN